MTTELAQLLREAAEVLERRGYGILASDLEQEAASLEAQEPVAFQLIDKPDVIETERRDYHDGDEWEPLYRHPPTSAVPECTRAMEAAAERYWNERRLKAFSNDPRTWKGVYEAMLAAAPQQGGGEDE